MNRLFAGMVFLLFATAAPAQAAATVNRTCAAADAVTAAGALAVCATTTRRGQKPAALIPNRHANVAASQETSMARVSTYLNFARSTEEAFGFYRAVFGTEFAGAISRFGEIPPSPDMPPVAEADKALVMHVELPILAGHVLMGTDAPESMGFRVTPGNNVYINLEPDTRTDTDRLFNALAEGGKVEMALAEMFWGGYYGSLEDRFGIHWMFNCMSKT